MGGENPNKIRTFVQNFLDFLTSRIKEFDFL